MKRKTSNILICVLAVVALGCAVMAVGTMAGWFANDKAATDEIVQTEAANENTDQQENTEAKSESADKTAEKNSGEAKGGASTCTISIKCSSVLKHMDRLESGKAKYVPSNGIILSTSTVEFQEGQSVYDILKRACSAAGIPMSAKSSSMGIYVEGINGLFEFDCGGTSGWMYSVNGNTPGHSCSEHIVKNGDSIVWYYTCGK